MLKFSVSNTFLQKTVDNATIIYAPLVHLNGTSVEHLTATHGERESMKLFCHQLYLGYTRHSSNWLLFYN